VPAHRDTNAREARAAAPPPHRNRVDPFGEIVATPERGTLMGNRGVIHADDGTIVRQWQVRRWIACRLEFKDRHREILQPRRWTELFFLDEATAIAAGHRPCAECRRADYKRWQAAWDAAGLGATNADAMDVVLHADRTGPRVRRRTSELPTGAMVLEGGRPWLVDGGTLAAWSFGGYGERRPAGREPVEVLTPASSVAVLSEGYRPQLHQTLQHR
jgi:hypothetical protein